MVVVSARAVNDDMIGNPYRVIVDRNVFDLKPPSVAPPPTNTPPPSASHKVRLTGITTILGGKRALFMIQETLPGKPPSKEESVILSEGQRQNDLEALEIGTKTVKIKLDGAVSVVAFDEPKLPSAPAAPAGGPAFRPPSFMQQGQPLQPPPPGPSAAASPVAPQGGVTAIGGANQNAYNNYANMGANNNNSAAGGLSNIPSRQVRTQPDQPQELTADEQMVLMELERERTKEQVAAGKMPPLPPTALTPTDDGSQPGTGNPRLRRQNAVAAPPVPGQ